MNEEEGKNQIKAVAAVVLGGILVVNLVGMALIGYKMSFLFDLVVDGIVFKFLFDGNEWARIAIMILLAIALVAGVFHLIGAITGMAGLGLIKGVLNIILNLIAMAVNGFGLYVTSFSPTIKEYTANHM